MTIRNGIRNVTIGNVVMQIHALIAILIDLRLQTQMLKHLSVFR